MIQNVNKSYFDWKSKNLDFSMILIYLNMIFAELLGKSAKCFWMNFAYFNHSV